MGTFYRGCVRLRLLVGYDVLVTILICVGILCASALIAALVGRSDRWSLNVGTVGALIACILGATAAIVALVAGEEATLRAEWPLPVGEIHFQLDALSGFFLMCVFVVSGLAALYGHGYLPSQNGACRLAPAVAFFNLLVAAMVCVVIAADTILFLIALEIMSLAAFFLVTYESDRDEVRRAGLIYLIASQLGIVLLFLFFMLIGQGATDFATLSELAPPDATVLSACFLLALGGFGAKAGFFPIHVWLPDAHAAAPSHVSAVMSGVMIKMGIYGLIRSLSFLGSPPPWWGVTLVSVGVVSGVWGISQALGQRDLKRRLAYSSVENVGLITAALGLALLGKADGNDLLVCAGMSAALLHTLHHGLFKGLLFQCAGSVLHATGTRDLESLGGLSRKMPITSIAFLVGALSISALPPFNGFSSEWLLGMSAMQATIGAHSTSSVPGAIVLGALAFICCGAVACFVSAFGAVFLGEPRTALKQEPHEAPKSMRASMLIGAACCIGLGCWPALAMQMVLPAVASVASTAMLPPSMSALTGVTRVGITLLALICLVAVVRNVLLAGRRVEAAATWGCGYAYPSARMQYGVSSFAQPILEPLSGFLRRLVTRQEPRGIFPASATYGERLEDAAGERMIEPAIRRLLRVFGRVRVLQHGRLHLYLLYIAITLVALLVWQLVFTP